MGLVEREREWDLFKDACIDCSDTGGGVIVVSGAVASGKTVLLQAFAEQMRKQGWVVLKAAASRIEIGLPLGVIGQLVSSVDMGSLGDGSVNRAPGTSLLTQPWVSGGFDVAGRSELSYLGELRTMLHRIGQERLIGIFVDDANYADAPSLLCLLYLARRLRSSRILLVLSDGLADRPEYNCFQADVLREPGARHIRLNALSHQGVASIIAGDLGFSPGKELVTRAHDLTGGNPLLLASLLEDHHAQPSPTETFHPGEAFGHAVTMCLLRCDHLVQDVARVIAVLDDEHNHPELVAEILMMDRASVAQALDALRGTGLLGGSGRFRHQVARDAVIHSWANEDRLAVHARAARVLREHGASATVLARHLIAGTPVTAGWVIPTLCEAAERALADNEVTLAIDALHTALALCHDEAQRTKIRCLLLRAQWRVDPSAAARHLPELLAAGLEGTLASADTVTLIAYLLWFGHGDQVGELLDALERRAKEEPDSPDQPFGLVELWLGCSYPDLFSRLNSGSTASADEALLSERSGLVRAAKLLSAVLRDGSDESAGVRAEQVLQGVRLDDRGVLAICGALVSLIYTGKLEEAAFWCRSLLAEPSAQSAPTWRAILSVLWSTIEMRWGRFTEAERYVEASLSLLSLDGWGAAIALPLANVIMIKTALGKYEEAESYLAVSLPKGVWQTLGTLHYMHARGTYYLATGRFYAALDDFQTCGEVVARWELSNVTIVPWAASAAEALLALGDRDGAEELARRELGRTCTKQFVARAGLIRVLAVTGEGERSLDQLEQAADLYERAGDRFELARTLAEIGRVYETRGDDDRAMAMERRAQHLAQECAFETIYLRNLFGAVPACTRKPPGTGHHAPTTELSEAELRVATLAANGHTNRQIAAQLFITVSTVEQHLTRVYRKLNVGSRADLPAELGGAISELETVGCVAERADHRRVALEAGSSLGTPRPPPGGGGLAPVSGCELRCVA
ncbi:LuxR family transcriptional regulator [Sphaerisporangium flaviroseum]|uniref:LuxR family transcriptional regulator n=1 Tax=Sphaerisporangium flaviroseum TaxID=509199 RepID=A0ABP7ID41_9ACTN